MERTRVDPLAVSLLIGALLLDGVVPFDGEYVRASVGAFMFFAALSACCRPIGAAVAIALGVLGAAVVSRVHGPTVVPGLVGAAALCTLRHLGDQAPKRVLVIIAVSLVASVRLLEAVPLFGRFLTEADELVRASTEQMTFAAASVRLSLGYSGLLWTVALGVAAAIRGVSVKVTIAACCVAFVAGLAIYSLSVAAGVERSIAVRYLPVLSPILLVAGFATFFLPMADARGCAKLCTVLLVASMAAHAASLMPVQSVSGRRIGFLEVGLQDWKSPSHGSYGSFSGGMFGRLPDWVRVHGAELRRVSGDDLTTTLGDVDTLFIVNLNEYLSEPQREAIGEFVERGGLCVVLADHTNVSGLQGPTNQLLEEYGIRVQFDSAKHMCSWPLAMAAPTSRWIANCSAEGYFPYGIGASFDLSGMATPLLKARHGFSDRGVRWNYVGAYLGNYSIDVGEDVGDVVIAARARRGDGAVVALGDTTPFQNGPLVSGGMGFLGPFLGQDHVPSSGWPLAIFAAIATVAFSRGIGNAMVRVAPGVLILAAVAVGASVPSTGYESAAAQKTDVRLCVSVLTQPVEDAPGKPQWKRTWSVARTAERAGYLTAKASEATEDVLDVADALLFVLPLARVSNQEQILRFIEDGGTAVIIGGPRHLRALDVVVERAGINIERLPRGSLPKGAPRLEFPKFPSAYSLTCRQSDPSTVLFRYGDVTAGVLVRIGRGSLVVIADEAIPYGDNIEGSSSWHLGNLAFFDRIWHLVLDT